MSIPRFLIPFLVLLQTWSLSFQYHRIPTRPKYSIRRCRPTFLKSTDTSITAELPADSSDEDAHYLSLALSQARTPPFGSTYPNPPVGCVIVSPSSEILGSGHHPVAGCKRRGRQPRPRGDGSHGGIQGGRLLDVQGLRREFDGLRYS